MELVELVLFTAIVVFQAVQSKFRVRSLAVVQQLQLQVADTVVGVSYEASES